MHLVVQLSTGTDTASCRGTKTVLFAQMFPFRTLRLQASHGEIIVLGIFRALGGFIVRLEFDLAI